MRVSTVLATVAGANLASAGMMKIAANTVTWAWAVTDWNAGCLGDTQCHYDFNVTAEGDVNAKPPKPSFGASCSGKGEGADYTICEATRESEAPYVVVAKLLPRIENATGLMPPQIQVSLKYTDLNVATTWWNYTGKADAVYNEVGIDTTAALSFTIHPDTIYGVA